MRLERNNVNIECVQYWAKEGSYKLVKLKNNTKGKHQANAPMNFDSFQGTFKSTFSISVTFIR